MSLRGLARRLGVSHAAPGYHFTDREALLAELVAHGHDLLSEAMLARLEAEPPNRLAAIGEGYLDMALAHPGLLRLMFSGRAFGGSPAVEAAADRSAGILQSVAAGQSDDEDPASWLRPWALAHGLATLWNDGVLASGFDPHGGEPAFRQVATGILAS